MSTSNKRVELDQNNGESVSRIFVDEGPNEFLKGQRFGLEVVHPPVVDTQSEYQHILVYNTVAHGRSLILDGVVQLTEADEFAYHEMIVHVPIFSCPKDPETVLLIGAGDGGAAREILKHMEVKKLTQVEIDGEVVEICKKYIPSVNRGAFEDSRLELRIADGLAFVKEANSVYDVVIVDSSDPSQGPNGPLFDIQFYQNLRRLMNTGSILCIQGENPWFYRDFLKVVHAKLSDVFLGKVAYYGSQVPTYPGGYIGFFICWVGENVNVRSGPTAERRGKSKALLDECQYYSPCVHSGAFALPRRIECLFIA